MRSWLMACFLIGCSKSPTVGSSPVEPVDPQLAKSLPFDSDVRSGTFDNGMKWFVEPRNEPEDRVVFRLAVDAGSALEDDDQRGIAHLLEHMAFNGTETLPGNELVTYLESVGTQFGPHLNAHTSFEETVYKLMIPSDDPEVLAKGFDVMKEWSCCLALDHEEIEKERGVVLEEWRRSLGARQRSFEVTLPMTYAGTPYPERMPIGTEESLKTFTPEAVERFFQDWYRPERMAIIVTGDIDPAKAEAMLTERFGALPASTTLRERPEFAIQRHADTQYVLFEDPELTRTSVSLSNHVSSPQGTTYGEYVTTLRRSIATSIVNERLGKMARNADAPFLGASLGQRRLLGDDGVESLGIAVQENGLEAGIEAAWAELLRAKQHGVLDEELKRVKARVLRDYQSMVAEHDNEHSKRAADELVRHFLTQETVPGVDVEAGIAQDYVPTFTKEQIQATLQEMLSDETLLITVRQPKKEGIKSLSQADIEAAIAAGAAQNLPPPKPEEKLKPLVETPPAPGRITATDDTYKEALGYTKWTLSNGIEVWWKKTDFQNDAVYFQASASGGTEAMTDELVDAGSLSPQIRKLSGVGAHDLDQLQAVTAGKKASSSLWAGGQRHGVKGSSSPDDLETALSLMWLQLNDRRYTPEKLAYIQTVAKPAIANRSQDPNTAFTDAWTMLLHSGDPRVRIPVPADVDGFTIEASQAFDQQIHGDPTELTFEFVGALPVNFEALVTRWIGGLEKQNEANDIVDRGFSTEKRNERVVVKKGSAERATYRTVYFFPMTREEDIWHMRGRLNSMGDILEVLLRETLREELSGVYSVRSNFRVQRFPPQMDTRSPRGQVQIDFTCDPNRVDELEAAMEAIIAKLATEGVPQRYVDAEIEKNLTSREESENTNSFWNGQMLKTLQRGEDPMDLLGFRDRNASITPDHIQDAAKRLSDAWRGTVVHLPQD